MRKSLLLIFVLFLGCGGDSGSGQCGSFTPCGGVIVGTWSVTEYCSNLTGSSSSPCPGMTANTSHVQMKGTFTFTSSGTYSVATTATGTESVTYPQSCLTSLNTTCAQAGTALSAGSGGISGSCQSNANGDCACTENITNAPSTEQGTYTTSGSSIAMLKTGSTTTTGSIEYCVQGNTLTLQATSSTFNGSTTLVATRQ